MKKKITAAAILLLVSCRSNEIGNSKDVNPETIYQEYNLTATEGETNANFTAQFRFGGENGTTLVLNEGSNVCFDDKNLPVDSSISKGAYYQTLIPMQIAEGQHSWKFTDGKEKTYTNKINFKPFALTTNFIAPITTSNLELRFSGLEDKDEIDINISDTSHMSNYRDLDTAVHLDNGVIILPASQIKKLAPGPIKIDVGLVKNMKLDQANKEGGRIVYIYQLKTKNAVLKK